MATSRNKTVTVAAEEVPQQVTPMFDHSTALKAYDPIEAGLQALRDRYGSIAIAGPDDNANYELATDAVKDLTSRRTMLEKKRKELKADALEYGRKVDGKAKEIEAAIRDIEDPIRKRIDEINAEREARKRAKETARIKALTEAGFSLIGQTYQVGNVGDFFDNIMDLDEGQFEAFVAAGAAERTRLEEERRQQQLEEERLAKMRAEAAELEAKLAAMKAQMQAPPVQQPARDWMDSGGDGSHLPQQAVDIWGEQPQQGAPLSGHIPAGNSVGVGTALAVGNGFNSIPSYTPAPPPQPALGANAKQVWFNDGWEACKNRIIKLFTEDQTPRKRSEWVEMFRNLKP